MSKGNEPSSIEDEAVEWAMRTMSGSFGAEDERALAAWLAADPARAEAYERYRHAAGRASGALDEIAALALEKELTDAAQVHSGTRRAWLGAGAAVAASIFGAGVFWAGVSSTPIKPEIYATAPGEMRDVALADGSFVSLNTNSRIRVSLTRSERREDLERGEALFDIVRDQKRPFVVAADHARTRVLGTRFNVYAKPAQTIVSVLSGVVEVLEPDTENAKRDAVTLIAGQEIVVANGVADAPIRTFNADAKTSWRRGVVVYENAPLGFVVSDLNRYFEVTLSVGDASLNDIPVTGRFDVRNHVVAIEALSVALSLRAELKPGNRIVLRAEE